MLTKMPYLKLRSASERSFNTWEKLSDRFMQNLSRKILFYIRLNAEPSSPGKLRSVSFHFHPVLSSQRKLAFRHFLHETSTNHYLFITKNQTSTRCKFCCSFLSCYTSQPSRQYFSPMVTLPHSRIPEDAFHYLKVHPGKAQNTNSKAFNQRISRQRITLKQC